MNVGHMIWAISDVTSEMDQPTDSPYCMVHTDDFDF